MTCTKIRDYEIKGCKVTLSKLSETYIADLHLFGKILTSPDLKKLIKELRGWYSRQNVVLEINATVYLAFGEEMRKEYDELCKGYDLEQLIELLHKLQSFEAFSS